jgi:hypothetical protein
VVNELSIHFLSRDMAITNTIFLHSYANLQEPLNIFRNMFFDWLVNNCPKRKVPPPDDCPNGKVPLSDNCSLQRTAPFEQLPQRITAP